MSALRIAVSEADHVQGDADAPVTLVEYGDYECPHCGHAYPIVKLVQRHFGKRLKFVFRNFPLNESHPHAQIAAEAAEFAAAQGQFWEMHDALFENQRKLGLPLFMELAAEIGLSSMDLQDALARQEYTERVRADFMGGVRSGVNGTPTFFINGQRHDGMPDYNNLVAGIDLTLRRAEPSH